MSVQQFLTEMKAIQSSILDFLLKENNIKENFQNLKKIFEDLHIQNDQHKLKSVLHLIVKIANNYHRGSNFFNKIDLILKDFKNEIKNYFSNSDIFRIFKSNKRILLFLVEENIMNFDSYVVKSIIQNPKFIKYQYLEYFTPEIEPYQNEKWFDKKFQDHLFKEIPEKFYEHRKTGENENLICEMIRKDSIDEFIPFVNENYPLEYTLKLSIFETNPFLLQKQNTTLIEYASFFGSVKIFKYLFDERVKFSESILIYSIHGQNFEIAHIIKDDIKKPSSGLFKECFVESIKCHNNNFWDFFINNNQHNAKYFLITSLKYYNIAFIEDKFIDKLSFFNLCKYDYYTLAKIIMIDSDVNQIYKIQELII